MAIGPSLIYKDRTTGDQVVVTNIVTEGFANRQVVYYRSLSNPEVVLAPMGLFDFYKKYIEVEPA